MRHFLIQHDSVLEIDALPHAPLEHGFLWVLCDHDEFEQQLGPLQSALQRIQATALVDFHVSDLRNQQLPSRYDFTSQYDVLVFRRLVSGPGETAANTAPVVKRGGPPALRRIDTRPVGFAVFERVLLTVHPVQCSAVAAQIERLLSWSAGVQRGAGAAHLPASPADLMLRLINQMVDAYLDLRRDLTRQLDHWQAELLHPSSRFRNWGALLQARSSLHHLDEICEDQRSALHGWIEALAEWDPEPTPSGARELELLKVRSRDVLEHIERVLHHVRRLEQNAETAVQMHFSVQSNRTNDIMRTLTALTAIFLPLNLIAGIFGMNFQFIPLIHQQAGFWWAMGSMVLIAASLGGYFWRKRYMARSER